LVTRLLTLVQHVSLPTTGTVVSGCVVSFVIGIQRSKLI
jgi:hypothetical protein